MNQYFAYTRVSTARQGEQGVSLEQQREAIQRYAQRADLSIGQWLEERETAAHSGRPVFGRMVKLLKSGRARGVVIHKIDRSARNLRDWADLGELIDRGVEVHFANEGLDLTSRGGRLSADIQAVVAADFIRNLKEETRKGFYGRLRQGILPRPAPPGYLNVGPGKPKLQDPKTAPLVRALFDCYSSGMYNFHALLAEARKMGRCGRGGKPLSLQGLSKILHNPFYAGVILIKKSGESFPGAHQPLISKAVFEHVQGIMQGKTNTRVVQHDFLFRRRLRCKLCGRALIGEIHKSIVYYRCQTHSCPTTAIREDAAEQALLDVFARLGLSPIERRYCLEEASRLRSGFQQQQADALAALSLRLSHLEERLGRLTDAYIDHLIDREAYEQRKMALHMERQELKTTLGEWESGTRDLSADLAVLLERADSACFAYKRATMPEKRELLDTVTSNRLLCGKSLEIMLNSPFDLIANRAKAADGSPSRVTHLTCKTLIHSLIHRIAPNPSPRPTLPYASMPSLPLVD